VTKRLTRSLLIALVIVLCLVLYIAIISGVFNDQIEEYPTTISSFSDTGNYKIDPETILESLDRGETDVFKFTASPPEVYTPPDKDIIYSWGQFDYWKIASALHQFVWQEDLLDEWKVFGMYFYTDCSDKLNGFAIGDFIYFKPVYTPWTIGYTAREIIIHPLVNSVSWGGNTVYPRPFLGWKEIDLKNLTVTADDALRIAEENGGREARLDVDNECDISLSIGFNTKNGWSVNYMQRDGVPRFEIDIDPYTGEYKIIDTSQ